ncbi:2,3,4,5-tetrahydropyridine-2,6-dicarboxylate N-succinyltransferase [Klebsiella michiganensis]|uniref:2,3,4,5-tetrahydropyridine-2,6-dicarboxylate N-succinyltransferase n=1 Tax=Klebsiella michiganensis TaxID=1134687 RepID=A0A7H4LZN3_9ENTR|nr:2,3,4,5-tetrahydropyridine-2,6-dicarboxylate N-succinyltransferase [Klebsiella michiganensis]
MPSYVNIGAYVDEGSMVDTWRPWVPARRSAKTSTCPRRRHRGVLEPLQANPTIIEDNCFIGARSEVVEGVIVEEGSVISMGVYLGQSTKIYDRETGEVFYGRVPAGSVVVSGNLPSKMASTACTARLSSKKSMPKPAARLESTNFCVPSTKQHEKAGGIPLFLYIELAKMDFFVNYSKITMISKVPLCTII